MVWYGGGSGGTLNEAMLAAIDTANGVRLVWDVPPRIVAVIPSANCAPRSLKSAPSGPVEFCGASIASRRTLLFELTPQKPGELDAFQLKPETTRAGEFEMEMAPSAKDEATALLPVW